MCSKALDGCSHTCQARCHTAVLTLVKQRVERAGPWDSAPEARQQLVDHPCPPCKTPVQVTCLGKHEVSSVCRTAVANTTHLCTRQGYDYVTSV